MKKIMTIEDNEADSYLIRFIFEKNGYKVIEANNGALGVGLAIKERPDLILMDINLPGEINGVEAANQIHSKSNIPIVFLTAHTDQETLERAKITDPFGYVTKPFDETNLRFAVEIAIYKAKIEAEREQLIVQLQEALAKVKTLSGFLPICANCKKIRDDKGYWNQIEAYIRDHSEAEFSHGICPDCAKKLYPEFDSSPRKS